MKETSRFLAPFTCHGVGFTGKGEQVHGNCLLCGDERHFYANAVNGLWDCKKCGESGNIEGFLTALVDHYRADTTTTDWNRLARARELPVEALKPWGLAWTGEEWLIPAKSSIGTVRDIRRWRPDGNGSMSTTGCEVQLIGAEQFNDPGRKAACVWILEGEWDFFALAWLLEQAGRADIAVGVPGAGIFKPEWVPLFEGRSIRLCYDNDDAGRKGAAKALNRLSKVAADIQTIEWPTTCKIGHDIRDFVVAARKRNANERKTLKQLAKLLRPCETPTITEESGALKGNGNHELATYILEHFYSHKGRPTLKFYRRCWWLWENGRYEKIPFEDLRALLNGHARQAPRLTGRPMHVNQNVMGEVVRALESLCLVRSNVVLPVWLGSVPRPGAGDLLPMTNGLLDIEALLTDQINCLREPTPDWFTETRWEYGFNRCATSPRWEQFLCKVLPGVQERKILQEFMGYCLTFDTSQNKFLVLVGEARTGKSVVTEVATELIGTDNVSHVRLEHFGDRFALASTVRKLANIASEIGSGGAFAESQLKAVSSGDWIQVEHKYADSVRVKPTARLIFSANKMPTIHDRSDGVWRRMIILRFDVAISEQEDNKALREEICAEELPGIFNWAVKGLRRLRKQGKFTVAESAQEALAVHRRMSNPAREFLEENWAFAPHEKTPCNTVYQRYRSWAEHQGVSPLIAQQFGQEVRRVFPKVARIQLRSPKREWHYKGLRPAKGAR